MEAGPIVGVTASTRVPGPATARAHCSIVAVIDAVVFGLMTVMSTCASYAFAGVSRWFVTASRVLVASTW